MLIPNVKLMSEAIEVHVEKHKQKDGIYEVSVMAGAKYKDVKYWITLQYLSVLKRSMLRG